MEIRIKKYVCALVLVCSLTAPVRMVCADIPETLSPAIQRKIEMIALKAADSHVQKMALARKWVTAATLLKVGVPVVALGVGGYFAGKYLYNKFERFRNLVNRGITFVSDHLPVTRRLFVNQIGMLRDGQSDLRDGQGQIQQEVGVNGERISGLVQQQGEFRQENMAEHQRTQEGLQGISENMVTKQEVSTMQSAFDRLHAGYNTLQSSMSSFESTIRHFFSK